ncbi:hypothetical protein [Confluentibacter citreus]|uniref:hypothetical protein n=1 Tax=Confluentibacter citreus TaxID=2007307 RepID=UPI000C28DDFD|nr:hypothetical protein [Confluentibacter citreus]
MSQIIAIHTARTIDANDLYAFLQGRIEQLQGEQKSEDGFYFYQDISSVRGIDFWKEAYGYELRTTILSNQADRNIGRWILNYFVNFVPDSTYFLEGEPVKSQHIASLIEKRTFGEDAILIKTLVEHDASTMTLFGPKGEFYIGPSVFLKIESDKEGWQERLQALILKVQYELPLSESDTVLESGGESRKILKLVNREVNYILKKYDYLIFTKDDTISDYGNMIFITNEVLNQHLPNNWLLIDEYTIVAPALSNEQYESLVRNLLEYDCREAFEKETEY